MKLKGKVALVTGSARGIGRGIAEALAAEGAVVVINGRKALDAAQEVKKAIEFAGGKAIIQMGDVSTKKDCDRIVAAVVKEAGRLDILVNNAGICPFNDFFNITEEEWDLVQTTNTKAVFLLSQAAAQVMKNQGDGGRIINVTSISGARVTNPQQVAYSTSKAAANMLTHCMASSLAPHGITVNAVLPGTIPTDINAHVLADQKIMSTIINNTPLRALGTPKDVADAVLYFASPDTNWVTGSLLVVDGGYIA